MDKTLKKALEDLEFPIVLQQVAARCTTEMGKERSVEIVPLFDFNFQNSGRNKKLLTPDTEAQRPA